MYLETAKLELMHLIKRLAHTIILEDLLMQLSCLHQGLNSIDVSQMLVQVKSNPD